MNFKKIQYLEQQKINGKWWTVDVSPTLKKARRRMKAFGENGRIVRVKMELVKEEEVR